MAPSPAKAQLLSLCRQALRKSHASLCRPGHRLGPPTQASNRMPIRPRLETPVFMVAQPRWWTGPANRSCKKGVKKGRLWSHRRALSVTEPQACQGEGLLHKTVGTGRKGREGTTFWDSSCCLTPSRLSLAPCGGLDWFWPCPFWLMFSSFPCPHWSRP